MRSLLALILISLVGCQSAKKSSTGIEPLAEQKLLGPLEVYIDQGKRSGEAYFSADASQVIFQSEVDGENPYYQIYLKDFKTNKVQRVSNGLGKTTCAWIMPDNNGYIFASTQADPDFGKKAAAEIEERKSPNKRAYSWDYDPAYEIYLTKDLKTYKNLTNTLGYDAEGSASPDGKQIVFSSNRLAYSKKLNKKDAAQLADNPSYFLDIYIMNADGSGVKRLTTSPGYDGGPFFSPDGKSIVWRRFSEDGRTAEVYTMSADGKNQRQITRMNNMSWAPFYHPSGEYIVFTTPAGGHRNFELFIVDTEGKNEPVQVTFLDGFDGLPVFTPDGEYLTWNRPKANGSTQVFRAKWDHEGAKKALGLSNRFPQSLQSQIQTDDLKALVKYFSNEEMLGRMTGSDQEALYTAAIADEFKKMGLQSYKGKYVHEFKFPKKSKLRGRNSLTLLGKNQISFEINKDWVPSNNSKSGQVAASEIVFAGYGFSTGEKDSTKLYDSYKQVSVQKKWVLLFQDLPSNLDKKTKLELLPYSTDEYKIKVAQQKGARGVIFISNKNQFSFDQSPAEAFDLPVLFISPNAAEKILATQSLKLNKLKETYSKDINAQAFPLTAKLSAAMDILREYGTGRNVVGVLKGSTPSYVAIGAHGDHLGTGVNHKTFMNTKDVTNIHYGADDNASGVAAVLEVAHSLAANAKKNPPRANIMFAIWSGEELGNLGSQAFLKQQKKSTPLFKAYLNLDMVGRLLNESKNRPLQVQGLGSGSELEALVTGIQTNLALTKTQDPYLPTDALSFYLARVPVISLFSGTHTDYHSPRDTADKIDYLGLTSVTQFAEKLLLSLSDSSAQIRYQDVEKKAGDGSHFRFKIYLGTIPDYNFKGNGVRLSGVVSSSPAAVAGLKEGDIILSYDGEAVKNLSDYMKSLQLSEADKSYVVQVKRESEFLSLNVMPKNKDDKSNSASDYKHSYK